MHVCSAEGHEYGADWTQNGDGSISVRWTKDGQPSFRDDHFEVKNYDRSGWGPPLGVPYAEAYRALVDSPGFVPSAAAAALVRLLGSSSSSSRDTLHDPESEPATRAAPVRRIVK